MAGYYYRENYTFRRICTWGCGFVGLLILVGSFMAGDPGSVIIGLFFGVGMIFLMLRTLKTTENWHLYSSLPKGEKFQAGATVALGIVSILLVLLIGYIVWMLLSMLKPNNR